MLFDEAVMLWLFIMFLPMDTLKIINFFKSIIKMYLYALSFVTGFFVHKYRIKLLSYGLDVYANLNLCLCRKSTVHRSNTIIHPEISPINPNYYSYQIKDQFYLKTDDHPVKISTNGSSIGIKIKRIIYKNESSEEIPESEILEDLKKFAGYYGNFHLTHDYEFNLKHLYLYTKKAYYKDQILTILVENDYNESTVINWSDN